MRHQVIGFSLTQTLFHGAFNTNQTSTELVFGQFTNTTDTAVTQVIDIINHTLAVTQRNQYLDGFKNIFIGKRHWAGNFITTTQTTVYFHAADT